MWPFKKKEKLAQATWPIVNSVLCIPGLWRDVNEIANTIFTSSNGDWMVVGDILISPKTVSHFKFEIAGRDEKLQDSFRLAGSVTHISGQCLDKIGKHNFAVYLSGKTGSLPGAYEIAHAAAAILKAGGLGVRIETTGKAFDNQQWLQNLKNFDETNLFEMFVLNTIIDEAGTVFSCGMHNLGLKDTIVSGLEFQKAVDLISIFGYYQIFEKPVLLPGQTFQPNIESPKYQLSEELNQPYKSSGYYANPFGMWRLS